MRFTAEWLSNDYAMHPAHSLGAKFDEWRRNATSSMDFTESLASTEDEP